jgi:hypothetical protein
MKELTGIALFTQDINWIAAQFRPPLIEVQCTTRYLGDRVWEVSEVTYRYSKYEINIDNSGVTNINIRISKIRELCINKVIFLKTPKISIDEAVKIAKRLIKANSFLLR